MKSSFSAAALLMLAACGDPGKATEDALAGSADEASQDERIECATDGATSLERVCRVERLTGPDGTTLIVRHPSGAFRQLLVATDGRGVIAADGADPAHVKIIAGDRIEVALAGDRYRLPATVKSAR